MIDTEMIKTTGRRVAADGASVTASMLRKAGERSARAAACWADALDASAAEWAPPASRTRRRVGIALVVVLAVAVLAALVGRARRERPQEGAGSSASEIDEARRQRSAS